MNQANKEYLKAFKHYKSQGLSDVLAEQQAIDYVDNLIAESKEKD